MILDEKITMRFLLIVYVGGCFLHVPYAAMVYDRQTMLNTLLAAVVWNIPVVLIGFLVKNKKRALYVAMTFAVIGIYRIGYSANTLHYAFVVFMIGVTITTLLFDFHVVLYCAFLTNAELLIVWLVHSDRIVSYVDGFTYFLMISFFETQLLISLLLVFNGRHLIDHLANQEQQLKQAVRSKDDFLANMSHEIRTPMNAVCGMCELILREEDISTTVRENSLNIQSAGRGLLGIINDLLDFSKIESGKMELICEPYNISSVVNDIVNMSIARKGDKKLEIYVDCDPDIPCGLIGDEIRIRQIITNLMTNAIKYTDKGYVYLKVRQRRTGNGINLQVAVEDTGMGIKPEDMEKLFHTFSQVDTKRNRQKEGTGLGLALCKRLVRQMGGFIQVSSEYGKGSVFRFTIPQKVSDEEPIIVVNEREKWNILGYADISYHKFNEFIARYYNGLAEKLNVSFTFCHSNEDFHKKLEDARDGIPWDYVFVGRAEYAGEPEFFNALAKEQKVILIQDRNDSIPVPQYMGCLYKPLYALSIASVLNGTALHDNTYNNGSSAHFNFTAPSAKVLIVDDNSTNLKVATGLLKPYQLQIQTADSGRKALDLVETTKYDIILMDHMMPEMDGVEATGLIRAMDGDYFKQVPIVALTANAVNGAKEMFLQSGMQDFISKPIETSTLERVLKRWIPEDKIVRSSETAAEAGAGMPGTPGAVGAGMPGMASAGGANAATEAGMSGAAAAPEGNAECLKHIDLAEGYKYMGGNRELYQEVLEDYYNTSAKRKKTMTQALLNENIADFTTAVHALKSISFSLGIAELGTLAKELEFAGKEGRTEEIREKFPTLMELFETVLAEIREFLQIEDADVANDGMETGGTADGTEGSEPVAVDPEVLKETLAKVLEAVQNFEREEALQILGTLPQAAELGKVKEALEAYDFGAAEDAIGELM